MHCLSIPEKQDFYRRVAAIDILVHNYSHPFVVLISPFSKSTLK